MDTTIQGNSESLTELEPLTLDDNTSVKMPFPSYYASPMMNSNKVMSSENELTNEPVYTDLMEYNRLQALTKDLPSDLFIDQLLLDYDYSCDKLDKTRSMLFETLRDTEDFPFGDNCEMKRRVMTRSKNGESLAVKLATDIHALLLCIEGGDFLPIKDMISTSKKATRALSLSKATSNQVQCHCNAELSLIRDSISGLKVDVLLIKQ